MQPVNPCPCGRSRLQNGAGDDQSRAGRVDDRPADGVSVWLCSEIAKGKGGVRLTKTEGKKVKQYLYSINRLELSVANLQCSLELLRDGETIKAMTYDGIMVSGGESISQPERYSLNSDRIVFLSKRLDVEQRKIAMFYNALEALQNESDLGRLGAHIVRHKYIQRISPDYRIYTLKLFCSRDIYYRAHRLALQFIREVIPDLA